jgi:hypothetical protein
VFQNAERMHYSRISRRTSGNELDVYRDPIWPKFQRLAFDFEHLTEKQVKDAAYFFSHSVGKDISIVDHQGIGWVGFVTTPESEIIQGTRSGFNLSFEFEGVMT